MKKILLLVTCFMLSVFAASAAEQPANEIDLLVGQTIKFYPAGTHLNGFSIKEGNDFVQVSRSGAQLTLKGLKAGDAILSLELRAGKESQLIVHVKSVSFIRPVSKTEEPVKPDWTGTYALRLPESNYSIIYYTFNSDGLERDRQSRSCIGDVLVRAQCFESEAGYDGMEDIISVFDFSNCLGYTGGLMPKGFYKLYYGDGNEIAPENVRDGKDWFEMYAPKSLAGALYNTDPAGFGRDNNGDDSKEMGTIMQRIRMSGGDQSKLNRFYRGTENVCGRECWVFDFRGKNFYGYGGFCVWVDPETGLVLRHESEEGGGFVVTRFDLDYHAWDIQIRPDLFK